MGSTQILEYFPLSYEERSLPLAMGYVHSARLVARSLYHSRDNGYDIQFLFGVYCAHDLNSPPAPPPEITIVNYARKFSRQLNHVHTRAQNISRWAEFCAVIVQSGGHMNQGKLWSTHSDNSALLTYVYDQSQ